MHQNVLIVIIHKNNLVLLVLVFKMKKIQDYLISLAVVLLRAILTPTLKLLTVSLAIQMAVLDAKILANA